MNLTSAYPNSALPAWQLTVMALVVVGTLAVWLIGVFLAARAPRQHAGEVHTANEAPDAREHEGKENTTERTAA